MKYAAALLISAALLLPQISRAASTNVTPQGKEFLNYAVQDSLGEISLCHMAEQKSSSSAVRSFCARAIADHKKMAAQATQLAAKLNLDVTQQPSDESQAEKTKLAALSAAKFDDEFMEAQVEDHEKDIKKANTVLGEAQNPQVKALIEQSTPVLQTHLKLAKTTLSGLK